MSLTQKHATTICCSNGVPASQCRYLEQVYKNGKIQCNCVKLLPTRKKKIDKDVAAHLKTYKSNPYIACGDGSHCNGYAYLPNVTQGFDVKS